jgi:flagellar biogenesis protein FliO
LKADRFIVFSQNEFSTRFYTVQVDVARIVPGTTMCRSRTVKMALPAKFLLGASLLLVASQATAQERTNLKRSVVDRSRSFNEFDSRTTTAPAEENRPISPAARQLTGRTENGIEPSRKTGSLWTTLVALGLVLGIILVTAKLWKKHGPRLSGGLTTDVFDVLGKRHIDSKQSVLLLRLGSPLLLVGSSSQGLVTLAEVDDPVEVDFLSGLARQANQPTQTIADSFRSLLHGQPDQSTPKFAPGPDDDILQPPTLQHSNEMPQRDRFSVAGLVPSDSVVERVDG